MGSTCVTTTGLIWLGQPQLTQAGGKTQTPYEYWIGDCVYLVTRYGTEVTSEAGLLPGPVSRKGWKAAREYLLAMTKWQLTGERTTLTVGMHNLAC